MIVGEIAQIAAGEHEGKVVQFSSLRNLLQLQYVVEVMPEQELLVLVPGVGQGWVRMLVDHVPTDGCGVAVAATDTILNEAAWERKSQWPYLACRLSPQSTIMDYNAEFADKALAADSDLWLVLLSPQSFGTTWAFVQADHDQYCAARDDAVASGLIYQVEPAPTATAPPAESASGGSSGPSAAVPEAMSEQPAAVPIDVATDDGPVRIDDLGANGQSPATSASATPGHHQQSSATGAESGPSATPKCCQLGTANCFVLHGAGDTTWNCESQPPKRTPGKKRPRYSDARFGPGGQQEQQEPPQ